LEIGRIVLDRVWDNNNNELMFLNSNSEYNLRNAIRFFSPPYVYYNGNNRSYPFPENIAIGYHSENRKTNFRLTLENSIFTNNASEVIV
jgi:hypothetical protein